MSWTIHGARDRFELLSFSPMARSAVTPYLSTRCSKGYFSKQVGVTVSHGGGGVGQLQAKFGGGKDFGVGSPSEHPAFDFDEGAQLEMEID